MADLEEVLDRYDVLWRNEKRPPVLDAFVSDLTLTEVERIQALPELIAIDMEYRWRQASIQSDPEQTETAALAKAAQQDTISEFLKPRPLIEDYVPHWSDILEDGEVPVSLIAEEFRIRQRWGDKPDISEFVGRFGERPGLEQALTEIRRELISDAESSVPAMPTDSSIDDEFPIHSSPARTLPDLSALKRYRILKTLGRGGMGDVFLAEDTQLDRKVALKTPHFLQGQTLRDRFINEAKAAATLRHPGICPVFDVGEVDGHPFLTMAYLEGQTLRECWTDQARLPVVEIVSCLKRMASAMGVAHEVGIVHRDLKPANVMIEPGGNPVIMDFGLACRAELPADQRITQTGDAFGSPAYMSPEQVDGPASQVGPASDIYSLGVMLYEGLTGELPFSGSVTSVLVKISTETPQPPSLLRRDVGPELDQLCLQMLSKDPAQRPESMAEVARRLAAIEEQPVVSAPSRSKARLKPHRRTAGLVAAVLSPMVLILLGLIVFSIKTPYGPLRIEVDEEYADQIKVRVLQDGELIEVADSSSGWSLSLEEGEYEFELGQGHEQFEIEPGRVEVSRDDEAVVSVSFLVKSIPDTSVPDFPNDFSDTEPTAGFALSFDGKDDFVQLPFGYDGSHPLTVEGWVTPVTLKAPQIRQMIVADNSANSWKEPTGVQFGIHNDLGWGKGRDGTWYLFGGTDPPAAILNGPRAELNTPVHFAVQVDAAKSEFEIFINGQSVATSQKPRPYVPSGKSFRIGADYTFEYESGKFIDEPFKGLIHTVRFSKRLRYNGEFTPQRRFESDDQTLALYHFDEGNGFTLKDSSGNGHDGEIHGAKWKELSSPARSVMPENLALSFDGIDDSRQTVDSTLVPASAGIRTLPGLIAEPQTVDGIPRTQLITRWPRAEPCCHGFSPNGMLYAIGSQDGYVRIFEGGPEGRLKSVVHVREQGNRPNFGFDWSADSKMLATACNDWIQIWSIDGQLLHEWQFKAADLQWHPRENILGCADRTGANVWKADGTELVRVDTWGSDRGSRFVWSADGESFLTVNGRFSLLWSRTGEMVKRIPGEFTVYDLAWSPDGTRIAVMTYDKQAIVMTPDGDVLAGSSFQNYGELDLRWSPDSQTFAISDQDNVTIYDREGTRLTRYKSMQFKTARNCFTFSPDGQQHLIVKTDGAMEIHNAKTGERAQHLSAGSPRISGVDWNQDSDLLVASVLSQRYPLAVVSRQGRVLHLPPPEATSAFDVAWDQSSGDIILGGDWWLWRFKSSGGDNVAFQKGDKIAIVENSFRIISVHPEGSMIAGAGYSESVQIVDASGSPTKRLALDRPVFALSFSPDGKWLAVNTGSDAVTVFDTATWEEHRQFKEPNLYGVAWSSDSSNIATMVSGGAVKVFDLGGQLRQQFEPHWRSGRDVSYRALAWSPDGQWIVSSRDIDVQAYNLSTGERRQFPYHVELVMDAAWISANEFVVVARDGTISRYDVESGKRVWLTLVLEDRSGRLQSVTVSAEGEILHADENVSSQLHYLREKDSGQFELQPFGG